RRRTCSTRPKERPMRDAEETCGHTVLDADGIEEPCGLPVSGWRYCEGYEHEDMLQPVCADHEQHALSEAIAAHDAAVAAKALRDAATAVPGWMEAGTYLSPHSRTGHSGRGEASHERRRGGRAGAGQRPDPPSVGRTRHQPASPRADEGPSPQD